MSATGTASVASALDDAPLTRAHWHIWFLAAMGIFLDAYDLFTVAVALPLIEREFSPGAWTLGLVAGAAPLGAIAGAAGAGRLTDIFGRRMIFIIDLAAFVLFAALSAFAWDVWSLIAFRFLLGVAVGADYPISSAYVAEFMPARVRGRMLAGAFSFQAVGALAGAAMGLIVLLIYPEGGAWRIMLASGILPALLILLFRRESPESPRWAQAHGRSDEAAAVVSRMVGQSVTATATAEPALPFRALFSSRFLRRTALVTIPWFLMDIGLYGVGLFTPTILGVLGLADKDPTRAVSFITKDIRSTEGSMFLDLFLILGFAIAIWLVDRWGRLRLQTLGFVGMAAGMLIVAMGSSMNENKALIFLGFALFNLLVNAGPNATTFALPTELFPTSIRASAHGLAAAAGKLGAAIGIFLLPVLRDDWGLSTLMVVVAGVCFLGFVLSRVLGAGLETTGRALDAHEAVPPALAPSLVAAD
jgi:MFS family permease